MATAASGPVNNNNINNAGGVDGEKGVLAGSQGNPGSGNYMAAGRRRIANPAPLGLISFASTTLLLSFVNVRTRGVTQPNIVVGMALGVGGLCQFLAGMWEFAAGNTFGATAFSSYGGFWFSFALILIPGTGVGTAIQANEGDALGLYLSVWFIFTFIMVIGSLRSNVGLVLLFFFLDMTFLLLTIGNVLNKSSINIAGGAFGIITSFIAYYVGASELMPRHASYVTLPTYQLPKRDV